jgi:hypothetical protein
MYIISRFIRRLLELSDNAFYKAQTLRRLLHNLYLALPVNINLACINQRFNNRLITVLGFRLSCRSSRPDLALSKSSLTTV